MKRVFIFYSRQNITFAERLARDLSDAGLEVWIDFRQIQGGEAWREAIFKGIAHSEIVIVCLSPTSVESEWVRHEILTARNQHKFVIPVMVTGCFDIMSKYDETKMLLDMQIIDFERFGYEQAFPLLLKALPGISPPTPETSHQIDLAAIPNPFKGLESFQQTDVHLFFGRESLIQKLLDRLDGEPGSRFVAVVGASGSGKSSLVRAGLIPSIRNGHVAGSAQWPIVILTPRTNPIESMATRLLPLIPGSRLLPEVVNLLKQGNDNLHLLVENILIDTPQTARMVLVIDQFEEIFIYSSVDESRMFIDLIHTAMTHSSGRSIIIVTFRADFFGKLGNFPSLATLFEQENMVIATEMTPKDLRRSIEEPARVVGLIYENGLVDRILDDVRQQPGSLPLLEYALKGLYERREGLYLTQKAYDAIGGVQHALAQDADGVYANLSLHQQDIMRRILLRLVNINELGEPTRRRLSRAELVLRNISDRDVQKVLDVLTGSQTRLIVSGHDIGLDKSVTEEATVWLQISHEALIREWKRLADWIAENRESIRYSNDLTHMAQEWKNMGHNREFLLTPMRLIKAELWLENADANELQREFIEASSKRIKRNQIALSTLQRFGLAFTAGFLGTALQVFGTFRTEAIFRAQQLNISISVGAAFGLLLALMIVLTNVLPRHLLRTWPWWGKLLTSTATGITLSTLAWGAYTWFLYDYPPDWDVMAFGGIGLALGFVLNATFNLRAWIAFLVTAIATYIPIYVMYDYYIHGNKFLQPIQMSQVSLLYYDYPDQIFTVGIPVVILIALIGHAPELWKDIQGFRKR